MTLYILLGLNLVIALVNMALAIRNLRETKRRVNVMAQWLDKEFESLHSGISEVDKEAKGRIGVAEEAVENLKAAVRELKEGTVPDYEAAKEAAKAMNSFNCGLSALLNYDPMEALQAAREGKRGANA